MFLKSQVASLELESSESFSEESSSSESAASCNCFTTSSHSSVSVLSSRTKNWRRSCKHSVSKCLCFYRIHVFFTHTSQISFPQMLFLVLPVRQILKHPSFTFFELLIWQLSVDDVCGDIGSKLLFQFRPQKPSPDSCCFGPMFVTNGDVETWTFPVTIAREPSFIQACVHGCSWATGELVSWLYQSGWTVVSKLYIDLVLVSTKNLPPAFAAIRLISWGVFGP